MSLRIKAGFANTLHTTLNCKVEDELFLHADANQSSSLHLQFPVNFDLLIPLLCDASRSRWPAFGVERDAKRSSWQASHHEYPRSRSRHEFTERERERKKARFSLSKRRGMFKVAYTDSHFIIRFVMMLMNASFIHHVTYLLIAKLLSEINRHPLTSLASRIFYRVFAVGIA